MENSSLPSLTGLGFLTAVELSGIGFAGGMLVLNPWGRPVEFHCTAPLNPSRTQQILYGRTLNAFIYCDQIGGALLEQAKKSPQIIFVDRPELLGLAGQTATPVVLVSAAGTAVDLSPNAGQVVFQETVDAWTLWSCVDSASVTALQSVCHSFASQLPFDEPFERIRGAIDEAHAIAR